MKNEFTAPFDIERFKTGEVAIDQYAIEQKYNYLHGDHHVCACSNVFISARYYAIAICEQYWKMRPAADEWGPWIEWDGGECPIPEATVGHYEIDIRGLGLYLPFVWGARDLRSSWQHKNEYGDIIAYRVKKSAECKTTSTLNSPTLHETCLPSLRDSAKIASIYELKTRTVNVHRTEYNVLNGSLK
jgi:hypothetical protein